MGIAQNCLQGGNNGFIRLGIRAVVINSFAQVQAPVGLTEFEVKKCADIFQMFYMKYVSVDSIQSWRLMVELTQWQVNGSYRKQMTRNERLE
ncbi:TPA: hypothetical protein U0V61_005081 [Escherichia coli]|nr:hypothetical protein [Escherichia marmotae]MEC9657587.1 hypothetical protein [Escherichia coli]MED8847825.1 hypothetical protein [Escherichia coli]MED9369019.1 hypothetical protein [Escherichia coli]MED9634530.1 hypothetical protein [Escherichia marmotae]